MEGGSGGFVYTAECVYTPPRAETFLRVPSIPPEHHVALWQGREPADGRQPTGSRSIAAGTRVSPQQHIALWQGRAKPSAATIAADKNAFTQLVSKCGVVSSTASVMSTKFSPVPHPQGLRSTLKENKKTAKRSEQNALEGGEGAQCSELVVLPPLFRNPPHGGRHPKERFPQGKQS